MPFLGRRDEAIIIFLYFVYISLPVLTPIRPKLAYRPTGVLFPEFLSGVAESYTDGRKLGLDALEAPGVRICDLRTWALDELILLFGV